MGRSSRPAHQDRAPEPRKHPPAGVHPKGLLMTFAREGWPFVLPFFALAALLAALHHPRWAVVALLAGGLVLLFFRNPNRHFAGDPATLLAPADGVITAIEDAEDPEIGPGAYRRVVTFLSVFDVHVQRSPASGKVVASKLFRGQKVAAFRKDAGTVNEQHLSVLELPGGDRIGVRQIAGLFARRVVCYLAPGQAVERGQLMGVIKFGSRVDLLVPASYEVLVQPGQRMRNGETPMARPRGAGGP